MSVVHFLNGHTQFITRLLLAVLVGGVLGFEREMHGHPAGFRTHILVCLGACLMAMIDGIYPKLDERIAAQVVTGVGFLGAGTIIRANQGLTVQGLTTAASLWATAGIGIAFGFGSPAMWLGCVTGVLVLLTLTVAAAFENSVFKRHRPRRLTATIRTGKTDGEFPAARLMTRLVNAGFKVSGMRSDEIAEHRDQRLVTLKVRVPHTGDDPHVAVSTMTDIPGVVSIELE